MEAPLEFGYEPSPETELMEVTLAEAQSGDIVTRMLAGTIPMKLKITNIHEGLLICGWWTFDQETGIEEDPELGWGRATGITGSYITKVEREP